MPEAEPEGEGEASPAPARRTAALIVGGGIMPAPLLAELIANGASVKPVRSPGRDAEPHTGHRKPSTSSSGSGT